MQRFSFLKFVGKKTIQTSQSERVSVFLTSVENVASKIFWAAALTRFLEIFKIINMIPYLFIIAITGSLRVKDLLNFVSLQFESELGISWWHWLTWVSHVRRWQKSSPSWESPSEPGQRSRWAAAAFGDCERWTSCCKTKHKMSTWYHFNYFTSCIRKISLSKRCWVDVF